MENFRVCFLVLVVVLKNYCANPSWVTVDELADHISPEDLHVFLKINVDNKTLTTIEGDDYDKETPTDLPVPETVDCFGLGPFARQVMRLFNMRPDSSKKVNTHFFFSSRKEPSRVQVYPENQFNVEWFDFKPYRRTIVIVHGFMSHSNASWVTNMTRAFIEWADVNVIAVDWSGGGHTWKYWRAVANTRRVGADVTNFLRQLMAATGAKPKDFHFVGHSLGAHICSYVSFHLGGASRITGLDPAQPCFLTSDSSERLDRTDADFVDIIHTNGRLLQRIGLGLPDPIGHADFYPNGGMKQPGCRNDSNFIWSDILPFSPGLLKQAICSHGRAYLLFTESLINNNCTFKAHTWNLTYEGVNASITETCDKSAASCAEMGIKAVGAKQLPRARGAYFVLTTEKKPYCTIEWEGRHSLPELLIDLLHGFRLDPTQRETTVTSAYIGLESRLTFIDVTITTITIKIWLWNWFGYIFTFFFT